MSIQYEEQEDLIACYDTKNNGKEFLIGCIVANKEGYFVLKVSVRQVTLNCVQLMQLNQKLNSLNTAISKNK